MKRFLLWLVGVALGVGMFMAAVMGVSYYFTGQGSLPDADEAQFGGAALSQNGYCWNSPLLGGVLDKSFASSVSLSVQKLGVLLSAHPALTVPDWAGYGTLSIADAGGAVVFSGTISEYAAFLYPSNGEYKAELTLWHLPAGMTAEEFEVTSSGEIRKNAGLEHPAKPTGFYHYTFRYTLEAAPEVTLSTEKLTQGAVAGMRIEGMVGADEPKVETDLGAIRCARTGQGWRCYIPAAYNATAGTHTITVTAGGQSLEVSIKVLPRDFGRAETTAEPQADEQANAQFRSAIWPLYEAGCTDKAWSGGWYCPLDQYSTLVDYGQIKVIDGAQSGQSNSSLLATIAGAEVYAPADGRVVFAGELALTGNTVVLDHGCNVRTYLYGLASISVTKGTTVTRAQSVGTAAETLTLDVKIGSRSINPWNLFQTSGGLFWKE